jgi:hypothetical protein
VGLIREARRRQRRRRTAIGVVVLASAVAALVFALAGPGGGTGTGSRSSSTSRIAQEDSGRGFAKYGLPCWALRAASLSIGPRASRWCRPDSRTAIQVAVYPPDMQVFPAATCNLLRASGIPVGPETGKGSCHLSLPVLPKQA